jgi:hypothetical protein
MLSEVRMRYVPAAGTVTGVKLLFAARPSSSPDVLMKIICRDESAEMLSEKLFGSAMKSNAAARKIDEIVLKNLFKINSFQTKVDL